MFIKGYVLFWIYEKKKKILLKDCVKGDNLEDIFCIFMYIVIIVGIFRFFIFYIVCV